MSWRIALLLFALAILTRAPFQTQNLWAHDSVLYERAIERFDPLDQRPQPPGYLYYVILIRAVDALTGDANRAMTLVSLFASAIAVALLYLLAARLYDERTARISALFLLSGVTFWAEGGVAYPYTLLAALSIGCALLFWRAFTSRRGADLLLASTAWGIAVGFRSDLAIFLAPLWLLAAWAAPRVKTVLSAATVAALVVVWYVGSGVADGGLARFADALRMQGQFVDERYSVFGASGIGALYANVYELGRFLGRGLYFLAPLVAVVPLSASARHIELTDRRRALFVALWTLTPLAVYVPIHSGEYGYIFSMLPGLCVYAARGAIGLARGSRMPRALPWIVAAVVIANSAIFLVSDTALSVTDVMRRDRGTTEKNDYLRRDADLDRATILTGFDTLVAQRYSTGAHALYGYDPATAHLDAVFAGAPCPPGFSGGTPFVCDNAAVLVVWDDLIKVHGNGWQTATMPHGAILRIARDMAGVHIRIDGLDVTLDR